MERVLGGGRKLSFRVFFSFNSGIFLPPPRPPPLACVFHNMAGLLPKVMRTLKSAIPTLQGCASPSEQPWRLPAQLRGSKILSL